MSARSAGTLTEVEIAVADVEILLALEFDESVPSGAVASVIDRACSDLAGEVPPAALPEFVHRLARQRLSDLRDASRPVPERIG